MPCTDGGYSDDQYVEQQEKINLLTRLLCDACQKLEEAKLPLSGELTKWWKKHQKKDKKRLESEMKAAQRKVDKEAALNRLTPYERKLLGL